MSRRFKTQYPGVFYREVDRQGARGKERVYYVVYKKDGKVIEAKAGRQFKDDMTPARANKFRTSLIEGRELTPQARRKVERLKKEAEQSRWTVNRLWALYCETHSTNKVISHESRKFDKYLRNEVGTKEPSELHALDVDRLRVRLQKEGKLTTAARVLELLRRAINFGEKRGLVPALRFKIEIPRLNNETTEDLTPEQLESLLKAMNEDPDQKVANIMRLALYSGMRRSEILKLKWEDLDFEKGFIRLVDPKGGRDQIIPMNGPARRVLEMIKPEGGKGFVFPGKIPATHLTECRVSLKRIRSAAGLPRDFRPLHGLRHVYASMLASSGEVDMFTLQKLLTHRSPAMTQRYAHLRDEALRRASDLAGEIITGASTKLAEKIPVMGPRDEKSHLR